MFLTAARHPVSGEQGASLDAACESARGYEEGVVFPASAAIIAVPADLVSGLGCRVLVLNRNYMAIRVASAKRALTLLYRDLAEVIHIEDGEYLTYNFDSWRELSDHKARFEPQKYDWVRTVRFSVAVPRIIRLRLYEKLPRRNVKFNRRNIFARDSLRCQYCGAKFPSSELSLDHVAPRAQGGKTTWENIVCCCLKCNVKKGGRTPSQANMTLITKPVKPKRSPAVTLELSSWRYRSWKQFLDHAYWSVELK